MFWFGFSSSLIFLYLELQLDSIELNSEVNVLRRFATVLFCPFISSTFISSTHFCVTVRTMPDVCECASEFGCVVDRMQLCLGFDKWFLVHCSSVLLRFWLRPNVFGASQMLLQQRPVRTYAYARSVFFISLGLSVVLSFSIECRSVWSCLLPARHIDFSHLHTHTHTHVPKRNLIETEPYTHWITTTNRLILTTCHFPEPMIVVVAFFFRSSILPASFLAGFDLCTMLLILFTEILSFICRSAFLRVAVSPLFACKIIYALCDI